MPEMKKYVAVNPLQRIIPLAVIGGIMFIAFIIFITSTFSFGFGFGFDFSFMLVSFITMVLPFALIGLLFVLWIRWKFINYDKWWASLTSQQRAEIEEDYSHAMMIDPCLIIGERYAYISQIGRPIAYEEIVGIYFRHSRNWSWVMNVTLNGVRTLSAYIPRTSDKDVIWDALSQRCNLGGAIDSMLHF